ncbi:MAG: hypothetical protein ABIP97_06570, partial [Chthoniobacterales bacterium]
MKQSAMTKEPITQMTGRLTREEIPEPIKIKAILQTVKQSTVGGEGRTAGKPGNMGKSDRIKSNPSLIPKQYSMHSRRYGNATITPKITV